MLTFESILAPLGVTPLRGGQVEVRGVQHDSRAVRPRDVFVALAGARADGARFVEDAAARGAAAIVAGRELETSLPIAVVPDPRALLGRLAAGVYGDPTARLAVAGITGTNGKTTTSYLVDAALAGAGKSASVIGTIGYRIGPDRRDAAHTTPEADDLQRLAREALETGSTHLVMEVSSHALAQRRVHGCRFAVAVFTNLTQDHLDYHGTMEHYAAAKRVLFTDLEPGAAVVNADDPFGVSLVREARCPVSTYSTKPGALADLVPTEASFSADGLRALVSTPGGAVEIRSPLLGRHNLENALAALGAALALGCDAASAARGIASVRNVPGRLERVADPSGRLVLVDYAHTPDALARALAALRPIVKGRLVCVFGCGGDRDREKRPLMGAAVARGADLAIVTSDNPRTEHPAAIIAEILPGLAGARETLVEQDRRAAIALGVKATGAGDCLLIAGKGHEDYQILGETKMHFSDHEEAAKALDG
ncbi:MAG: UDP-N-acetylmuramoyl-L-alanyl-D-glutamate--2,6-diaminopimelate ligase [Deltaproteobacteria bacterium]|nr:UDP-N-acetylmuramoyl-L-alanyl-D-glutamate--2,6-diaminopimelate ligase [Deltaproteobacteria bacterium]